MWRALPPSLLEKGGGEKRERCEKATLSVPPLFLKRRVGGPFLPLLWRGEDVSNERGGKITLSVRPLLKRREVGGPSPSRLERGGDEKRETSPLSLYLLPLREGSGGYPSLSTSPGEMGWGVLPSSLLEKKKRGCERERSSTPLLALSLYLVS